MNFLTTLGAGFDSLLWRDAFGVLAAWSVFGAIITFIEYVPPGVDAAINKSFRLKVSRNGKIASALLLTAFAGFTFIAVSCGNSYNAEQDKANSNLATNLKQKYDIKSVDLDQNDYKNLGYDRSVRASSEDTQQIIVITNDGKKAEFMLKQDVNTNEPTLSELPEIASIPISSITRH
jgi:hypothetical protein